jgi:hypothetical protein
MIIMIRILFYFVSRERGKEYDALNNNIKTEQKERDRIAEGKKTLFI